ncbi:MAG: hypothetical protein KDK89_00075 [Alphaproteobacteria bacterium]|nr:hypothetical protein [Alphaproteobacteria bacterium]
MHAKSGAHVDQLHQRYALIGIWMLVLGVTATLFITSQVAMADASMSLDYDESEQGYSDEEQQGQDGESSDDGVSIAVSDDGNNECGNTVANSRC